MARQDLKKLVQNHTRRLLKLREQQALLGLDTPPNVLIEMEDIEARLEELQRELEHLPDDHRANKPHRLLANLAQALGIKRMIVEHASGEIEEWVMPHQQE
ncbi:MAG: hypothetical protein HYR94_00810 [Chloroflexi bacterium]|nr:hypothetical protein [Chloroflexota bacterium]